MRTTILLLAICIFAVPCFAQEHATQPTPAHDPHHAAMQDSHQAMPHEAPADSEPHPALSTDPSWSHSLVTFIITLFVLAAAVGSLSRLSLPAEPPPADDAHSHDEHDAHGGHDAHAPAPAHGGHH